MTPEFREKLQSKLASYQMWVEVNRPQSWRLVQYCGLELIGAFEVAHDQIESQITGLLCEGFFVDWALNGSQAFLRVYEFDDPEPPWESVFSERHLADVEAILKEAGFGNTNS